MSDSNANIIRALFAAYLADDRSAVEARLTEDSGLPAPTTARSTSRLSPGAGAGQRPDRTQRAGTDPG